MSFRFFTIITDELNSVFGTYHIEIIGSKDHINPEILEILSTAVERSHGTDLKLDLIIKPHDEDGVDVVLDPVFVKEILRKYKDKITAMHIPFSHVGYEYLLEQDFDFERLEKLDILLGDNDTIDCPDEDFTLQMKLVKSLISRHANKLQHIGINYIEWYEWFLDEDVGADNQSDIPCIPNLKSLALVESNKVNTLGVMRTVNFENITHLKLEHINLTNLDIKDFNIKNLSVLSLYDVNEDLALSLLKASTTTLTKLVIEYVKFEKDDIKCLRFTNLKYLEVRRMDETISLTLVKSAMSTLQEILVSNNDEVFGTLETVTEFKLPCLKKIDFQSFQYSNLVFSLIYACNTETIEVLFNKEKGCKNLIRYLRSQAYRCLLHQGDIVD